MLRAALHSQRGRNGYDLTRLMIGSEGTLGIITEVTLRLHGIPEAISSAVCSFETLGGAVDTVVQAIQIGIPLARVEILDDVQMRAINRWSKLDYPELTTLFFEFHGTPANVAEQVATVGGLASANGGGDFQFESLSQRRPVGEAGDASIAPAYGAAPALAPTVFPRREPRRTFIAAKVIPACRLSCPMVLARVLALVIWGLGRRHS